MALTQRMTSCLFNEAVSFQVHCDTQQCGWLKDRYGLSWQIVPSNMDELFADETAPGTKRAMLVMLGMKNIEMAALERARAAA